MPAKTAAQIKRQKEKDKKKRQKEAELIRGEHEAHGDPQKEKEAEARAVQATLAKFGRTMVPIAADGSCLFAAIAQQANLVGATPAALTQQDVREMTAEHIVAHLSEYEPFYASDDGSTTLAEHCEAVRRSSEVWGSMLELRSAAEVLRRPIFVVRAGGVDCVAPVINATAGQSGAAALDDTQLCVVFLEHTFALGAHYNGTRAK